MIYDHKVVITSLKEKFGVLIESKQMAEAQKHIFDLIWKSTEEYDKTITEHFEKECRERFLELQKFHNRKESKRTK